MEVREQHLLTIVRIIISSCYQLSIGVTLVEESAKGSKDISSRDYAGSDDAWKQNQGALLTDMLDETDGKLVAGRNYKEALSVKNSSLLRRCIFIHNPAILGQV